MKKTHGHKIEAIAMFSSEGERVEFGNPVLLEGKEPMLPVITKIECNLVYFMVKCLAYFEFDLIFTYFGVLFCLKTSWRVIFTI